MTKKYNKKPRQKKLQPNSPLKSISHHNHHDESQIILTSSENNKISYEINQKNSHQSKEKTDLKQIPKSKSLSNYKKWIYGIVFTSSIPLFSAITAFSTAPETITNAQIVRLVKPIQIETTPLNSDIHKQTYHLEESVRENDSLETVIKRSQISVSEAFLNFIHKNNLVKQFGIYGNNPVVAFETNSQNQLISLKYRSAIDKELIIKKTPHSDKHFSIEEQKLALTRQATNELFELQNPLTKQNLKRNTTGISQELAETLAEIFQRQVDIYKTLQKGDKIRVVRESLFFENDLVQQGQIKAIQIEFAKSLGNSKQKTLHAFLYKNQYYSEQGISFGSAFLETPVEFASVTSGYDLNRVHPILGYSRHHLGVDFAGPEGSRVKAMAQGTVTFIGQQNGYGNVVVVSHPKGYSTLYAHLKEFAPTISVGDKVAQGDVIAYLGSTGLATGPHVHYELRLNGQHIDPFGPMAPLKFILDGKYLSDFKDEIKTYVHLLNETTNISSSANLTEFSDS